MIVRGRFFECEDYSVHNEIVDGVRELVGKFPEIFKDFEMCASIPGTKLDAREQLLKKEELPVATSRVTRLKLSGRVREEQLRLLMHTHGRYKTKGEHNEDF